MGTQDLVGDGTEHLTRGAGDVRRRASAQLGGTFGWVPDFRGKRHLARPEGERGGAMRHEARGGAVAELGVPALPASSVLSPAGGDQPLDGSGN